MDLAEFIAMHGPALERDQPRHNLVLGLLERAKTNPEHNYQLWSLDRPGACAIRTPGRGLLLGELSESEARQFARETSALDYPTVQGTGDTANWFIAEAETLGLRFKPDKVMRIQALSRQPTRPAVPGSPRRPTVEDTALLMMWWLAFIHDADLLTPRPQLEDIDRAVRTDRYWLWTVDGQPVSMAALMRRTRDCGSIAPVYTPPEFRGRGFAGAVTATAVDQIFAEGRRTACLYVDVTNAASNRCYAKLGFTTVCESASFQRVRA
jgi:ribosomal protein S18 acetylase RimI-like enzyme